jgi:signal transduction histidine kinase
VFVDNALKYTEKGGAIALRLLLRDGVAEATVLDTGIGIPEQDLPNVFDRFYRVDSARERNTGGHGLGLSIARIIVLRHNGRITVGSKVGAGTRFTVKLPLRVKDLARSTVGPLPNRQEDCT